MPRTAPLPPRLDLWPEALRSAERLRGSLVPCGPGMRGIGWPETPTVRATALAPWLAGDRVATHLTAAWIWGAAHSPGRPLRVTVRANRRSRAIASEFLRVHELRHRDDETQVLGAFRATTPFRTVLDLLHDDQPFDGPHRVACRLLARSFDGGFVTVEERLRAHRRPRRALAIERLIDLTGR